MSGGFSCQGGKCAVIDRVIQNADLSATDKVVGVYLVNRSNAARVCWPSVDDIAAKVGIHRRTVMSATTALESFGVIKIKRRKGARNDYVIIDPENPVKAGGGGNGSGGEKPPLWPELTDDVETKLQVTVTPPVAESDPVMMIGVETPGVAESDPVWSESGPEMAQCNPGSQNSPVVGSDLVAEEPVTETALVEAGPMLNCDLGGSAVLMLGPVVESAFTIIQGRDSRKKEREDSESRAIANVIPFKGKPGNLFAGEIATAFEAFWVAYPRRVAKGAARKAFDKACARVSPVDIMAGLRVAKFSSDPQYQPHPATWLNQERWADERQLTAREAMLHKLGLMDDAPMDAIEGSPHRMIEGRSVP